MTELLDLASTVVGWAGADEQVEVYLSRARTTSVRVYEGDVESLSSAEPMGAGIRVVVGGRQGFAWVGSLDEALLKETLQEARDNVGFAEPDEYNGLAVPDGVAPVSLDLVSDELVAMPTNAKIDLAIETERAARVADPRVSGVEMAAYGDRREETAVATTTGIAVVSTAGMCAVSVVPLVTEGDDTQSGYGYSNARGPSGLDPVEAASFAADRAARLLGGTKPVSRRLTAVLDPEVASAFLGLIGQTLSGDAVLKGRSLFANREGEMVASPLVSLFSDPTDAGSSDAEAYDGEGLAHRRVSLIDAGRLEGFLYDTYSGRRAGRASTGSASWSYASAPGVGAPALTVLAGDIDPSSLIGDIDDGVYVQDVTGLHSGVNPVSGDFSVGAKGLMITRGAFAEPFREATIASTLQRMLLDVTAVGSDLCWLPGGTAGVTLVIKDVSLGGELSMVSAVSVAIHLTFFRAIILGLLQGVTELFPLSSLGHSVLLPAILGWNDLVRGERGESGFLAFLVGLHVATALSLLGFFWRDWVRIIRGGWTSIVHRKVSNSDERLFWLLVIVTIPVGVIGLAFEHRLRTVFAKPTLAATFLFVNGVILYSAERLRTRAATKKLDNLAYPEGFTIGLFQSLALLAGISRSGVTMVGGLVRGLDHEDAAKFAFLAATPAILGAGVVKFGDLTGPLGNGIRGQIIVGSIVAAAAAWVSVRYLVKYFETKTLTPFAIYCLVVGGVCAVGFGTGLF